MADGIYSALSGAISQTTALETTAQNAANTGTAGYHAGRPVFREVLARAGSGNAGGNQTLRYTTVSSTQIDDEPGAIRETGRPLDVALEKGDFLAVGTARGERYTRAGSLRMSPDGKLLTQGGDPLLADGGQPLQLDPQQPVQIGPDGDIRQGGSSVGHLKIVRFEKPAAMDREGATLLAATPGSGAAQASKGLLSVGSIEESSASPMRAMTDLVQATRMFEAFQKTIEAFHDADRKVLSVPSR